MYQILDAIFDTIIAIKNTLIISCVRIVFFVVQLCKRIFRIITNKAFITLVLLSVLLGGLVAYNIYSRFIAEGEELWQEQASAYPTKREYAIAHFAGTMQQIILNKRWDIDGFAYRFFEDMHRKAYESAMTKMDEDDGERLLWEYNLKIRPIVMTFYSGPKLVQKSKLTPLLKVSEQLAIKLPEKSYKNDYMHNEYRYVVAHKNIEFFYYYTYENIAMAFTPPKGLHKLLMVKQTMKLLDGVGAPSSHGVENRLEQLAVITMRFLSEFLNIRSSLDCTPDGIKEYFLLREMARKASKKDNGLLLHFLETKPLKDTERSFALNPKCRHHDWQPLTEKQKASKIKREQSRQRALEKMDPGRRWLIENTKFK